MGIRDSARRAPLGTLTAGHVSARRAVPEHIERPEYMFHDGPEVITASDVKDAETVERIRAAGGKVTREAGPVKGGSTIIAFVQDPDGYKIELIESADGQGGKGLEG